MLWTPGFQGNQQQGAEVAPVTHCLLDLGGPSPSSRPTTCLQEAPQAPGLLWLQSRSSEAPGKLRRAVLRRLPLSSWLCRQYRRQGGNQQIKSPLWEKISHTFCSLFRPKGAHRLPQRNIMQGGMAWSVLGCQGSDRHVSLSFAHTSLTAAVT